MIGDVRCGAPGDDGISNNGASSQKIYKKLKRRPAIEDRIVACAAR
jgi:hypothetical protein